MYNTLYRQSTDLIVRCFGAVLVIKITRELQIQKSDTVQIVSGVLEYDVNYVQWSITYGSLSLLSSSL